MRLYYEALSKIPKKFIHSETQAIRYCEDRVVLCNPNFAPMIYVRKEKKWRILKSEFGSFLKNENIKVFTGELGFNPRDWKITQRTANVEVKE